MSTFWRLFTINDWLNWNTQGWLSFAWAPGGGDDPANSNLVRPNERPMVRSMVRLMVGNGPRP